jgi:hypothetical protein
MKPATWPALVLLALASSRAQAQQPASPYETVTKEMLAATEGLTAVLVTIKNADTAMQARPELKKAAARLVEVRKKAEVLKQPDQQERDRVSKAYAKKLKTAIDNFLQERSRVATIPGGRAALQELAVLERQKTAPPEAKEKK